MVSVKRLVAAGLAMGLALPGTAVCSGESVPVMNTAPATSTSVTVGEKLTGIAVSDSLFDLSDTELGARLDQVKSLGANAIRVDFEWGRIQPDNKDSYNWDETDHIVASAKKRGLAVLAVVGFTPEWARDPGCANLYSCAPHDPEIFANFAAHAAVRYKEDVRHIEIWNEPNIDKFFGPNIDAQRYATLLTMASQAIKAAAPNIKVAVGGLAPAANGPDAIAPIDYLDQLYTYGASGFDAVAIHPYSYPALPLQPHDWSAFTQIEGGLSPNIHSVMAAHGDGAKEVWLTEYGAPTHGADTRATIQNQQFDAFSEGSYVSEELQAQMIREFLGYNFTQANVTVRMVYGLHDRKAPGQSQDREDYFGIFRADGSPKKAADAFKTPPSPTPSIN